MYPKFCIALAGLYSIFTTACSGVHNANRSTNPFPPAINSQQYYSNSSKQTAVMGPPEYIPEQTGKSVAPKIIERGGRYVYTPPSYMMRKPEKGADKYAVETLRQKAHRIKAFAAANNYDTTVAFFIDMQVKSGKERFFVVNLADKSIEKKGLVAHGKGNEKFTFDRQFSNDEGSNCTSLGLYKIGKAYNGAFGLSYKLYGLNKTNSNALKRYVVLHSMGSIPDAESKWPITQTEGCPAVAPSFLAELAPILDKTDRTVLLYIYFGNSK